MGNCVRKGSSAEVAARRDIIKCPVPVPVPEWTQYEEKIGVEEGEKIGREIKIKITKKQLEELLGKVEVQGMPLQLLLAELIIKGQDDHDQDQDCSDHQRSWRPTLQTIPE